MKTYLIDLDGTMYRGDGQIEGAIPFIEELIKRNQPFYFLTNNSKRTRKQNVEHMEKVGFHGIKEEHFFTSAMAAARYAKKHIDGRNAYYVGQDGLKEALEENGFILSEKNVDVVFVGLNTEATYKEYSKALGYLLKGAKLIGTNNDRILAQKDGFSIGNGSIVAMFEYASGQKSPKIGKPHETILLEALDYFDKTKEEVILIGDNLETDILLGNRCDIETIFVTSGVHQREDIEKLGIHPDYIVDNLCELLKE